VCARQTKFLDGYTIDIFLFPGVTDDQADLVIREVLEKSLPGSVLLERHGRFLRFEVPKLRSSRLGSMFRNLEELKGSKRIGGTLHHHQLVEDYSIRQCDLEQVFLKLVSERDESNKKDGNDNFAKEQSPPAQHPLSVPMADDSSCLPQRRRRRRQIADDAIAHEKV